GRRGSLADCPRVRDRAAGTAFGPRASRSSRGCERDRPAWQSIREFGDVQSDDRESALVGPLRRPFWYCNRHFNRPGRCSACASRQGHWGTLESTMRNSLTITIMLLLLALPPA